MKKFLLFFLSICVVITSFLSVFAASCLPENFSLCDFSDLGIPSLVCNTTSSSPKLDGKIESAVYGKGTNLTLNSGLFIHSGSKENIVDFSQANYLSADENYFYIGVELSSNGNYDISPFDSYIYYKNKLGYVYSFTLNLGMTPGESPYQRESYFSNTYYFSAESLECVCVLGNRGFYTSDGKIKYALKISSYSSVYENNGFTDADGEKWTAAKYMENAVLSEEISEENQKLVFEFKVPIEDVLLSVSPENQEEVRTSFFDKEQILCGTFGTKLSNEEEESALVAGFSLSAACPYSEEGKDWKNILSSHFNTQGTLLSQESLPLPIYLTGKVKQKEQTPTSTTTVTTTSEKVTETTVTTTTKVATSSSLSDIDKLLQELENGLAALLSSTTTTTKANAKETSKTTSTTTNKKTTTSKSGSSSESSETVKTSENTKNSKTTSTKKTSANTTKSSTTKTSTNAVKSSTAKTSANTAKSSTAKTSKVVTSKDHVTLSSSISVSEELVLSTTLSIGENDEGIFDHLPDEEDFLPEDTEIVYLSSKSKEGTTKKNEEGEESVLGQVLLTATALLLFVSVMIFASVSEKRMSFREKITEKEEKRGKKGKNSSQKQNENLVFF